MSPPGRQPPATHTSVPGHCREVALGTKLQRDTAQQPPLSVLASVAPEHWGPGVCLYVCPLCCPLPCRFVQIILYSSPRSKTDSFLSWLVLGFKDCLQATSASHPPPSQGLGLLGAFQPL